MPIFLKKQIVFNEFKVKCPIDHVNFVYNKCDLVYSLSILAGKILHWSFGKVAILCHNFSINPRVMKVKARQVLRCAPSYHIKSL